MLHEVSAPVRSNSGLDRSPSQKLAKLVGRQSSVPDDAAHRERVHWIGSRDCQNALAVRHNDMLAFRTTWKPAFSRARTARLCETPEIFGT